MGKAPKEAKVHLKGSQATLLVTLHAKAKDYTSKKSILGDKEAYQILDRVDYDFEKLKGFSNSSIIVIRARQYDEWLRKYLKIHKSATVLNLGCGLDTRITRIKPSVKIRWFDIDYPDVIKFRKKFYEDGPGYKMLGYSLTDFEWIKKIPKDQPTIIVLEGVLEYLAAKDVKALINQLTKHFHGEIVFDVMSSFAINSGRSTLELTTGATHQWAVDDTSEVKKIDKKLHELNDISVFQSPYVKDLPSGTRLLYSSMAKIPRFRDMLRLLRYEF